MADKLPIPPLWTNTLDLTTATLPPGKTALGNEVLTGGSGGGVSSVTATAPIASSGGTTPNISMDNSTVTPGTYGDSGNVGQFTVDAHGLLQFAGNVPITGFASSTLTNAHIFVGNGSNVATDVAMSGEVTITNTGVTTFGLHSLTAKTTPVGADEFVLSDSAASFTNKKITFTNLLSAISTGVTPTLTATEIGFGSGTNTLTGSSALTWDDTNGSLTAGGKTVTTSHPVLNLSQTWNAGAVNFAGAVINITNTASDALSRLQDWQIGGSSVASVAVNGFTTLGTISAGKFPDITIGAAGSTQYAHMFRNNLSGANAATVQNLSSSGYSAINFADNTGNEHAAIGYGNASAAGSVFQSTTYFEASAPTGTPPDMLFISTVITGPVWRKNLVFTGAGQTQFFRSQSGNAESAHMESNGNWLFYAGASSGGTASDIITARVNQNSGGGIVSQNVSTGTSAFGAVSAQNSTNYCYIRKNSTGFTTVGLNVADTAYFYNVSGQMLIANEASADIIFAIGGTGTVNERFRIPASGIATSNGLPLMGVQIGQVTTSGSQSTITFSAISGSYTNLVIEISGRDTATGTDDSNFRMLFNGDTTAANYTSSQFISGTGSTAAAGTVASNSSGCMIGKLPGSLNNASAFGSTTIRIQNYSKTTFFKAAEGLSFESFAASSIGNIQFSFGWKSTAAITSITLTAGATAFVNGTVATLYALA